jgi:hypothetical protein
MTVPAAETLEASLKHLPYQPDQAPNQEPWPNNLIAPKVAELGDAAIPSAQSPAELAANAKNIYLAGCSQKNRTRRGLRRC